MKPYGQLNRVVIIGNDDTQKVKLSRKKKARAHNRQIVELELERIENSDIVGDEVDIMGEATQEDLDKYLN